MRIESTKCDECGRIKGEGNHWHQLGIFYSGRTLQESGEITVELGTLTGTANNSSAGTKYDVHDLCGEQCFYKHIGKLLKLNPVEIDTEALGTASKSLGLTPRGQ